MSERWSVRLYSMSPYSGSALGGPGYGDSELYRQYWLGECGSLKYDMSAQTSPMSSHHIRYVPRCLQAATKRMTIQQIKLDCYYTEKCSLADKLLFYFPLRKAEL
ncbi:hypothetical protein AVEN_163995-1 [Araneus ventricosus]|uniref:Uncharacterized protein n=1 Tax=Araneus ventricosus TaxID=182803 RepID=A0A4Y2D9Z5_ARAVE|nr:hypothetical protein AVEN_163995-1 [Araneus ventricosus]